MHVTPPRARAQNKAYDPICCSLWYLPDNSISGLAPDHEAPDPLVKEVLGTYCSAQLQSAVVRIVLSHAMVIILGVMADCAGKHGKYQQKPNNRTNE